MIRYDSAMTPMPGMTDVQESNAETESSPDSLTPGVRRGWTARAGRRSMGEKLSAGCRGLKYAVRGDSSFFAHAYRTLLVALAAVLFGVGPWQWCLIALAAALILVAELAHSAIDTMARAVGDPDSQGLTMAREIATAGVLVAVTVGAAVWITIFVVRLGELLSWW
jgi:diacylglycerol kinase (ATP)